MSPASALRNYAYWAKNNLATYGGCKAHAKIAFGRSALDLSDRPRARTQDVGWACAECIREPLVDETGRRSTHT